MDTIDRVSAAGGAVLMVGTLVLVLVGSVMILTAEPSERPLRNVSVPVDEVRRMTARTSNRPVEREPAVAAVAATPAPDRPGSPSPTPTPARTLIELPTTLTRARVANETPVSLPPAPATPGPLAPPAATPMPTPQATPEPQPTPLSTPLDACLQAESGIVRDRKRIRIERGSLVSYEAGVLVLATADGPVSLVITAETQLTGHLAVATQVRVEAHLAGNGDIIAKLVEVLCTRG